MYSAKKRKKQSKSSDRVTCKGAGANGGGEKWEKAESVAIGKGKFQRR